MRIAFVLLLSLAVVACKPQSAVPDAHAGQDTQPKPVAATQPSNQTPSTVDKEKPAMDLNALVPQGYKVADTQKGDLNGDGVADALLLVEDSADTSQVAGEGAKRKLLILVGDKQGKYTVAAVNDKIVPCATCGGIAGDPFSYMRIDEAGTFVVALEGGSSEHWANVATFKFSKTKGTWLMDTYVSKLWEHGDEAKIKNIDKAHGVAFGEFDPKKFEEDESR